MTTFEEVDKHVKGLGALPPITQAQAAVNLCIYYKAAKPILVYLESFPFFPTQWKTVLTGLTTLLDTLCP